MIDSIKFDNVVWSHIVRPTEEDLQALHDFYHFHPLDLEDCRSPVNLRPKIDVYDNYYFLILHFPTFDATGTFLDIREIKIFWGKDFLITLGKSQWIVKEIFTQEKKDNDSGRKLHVDSSDALFYRILEHLMEDATGVVERINKAVEKCGVSLFSKHAEKTIEQFSITRKNVILLNTMFKPQLALFNKLQSGTIKGFAENMEEYWGNILDSYQRVWDIVEDAGELIKGYSMTFDSLQVNKTNEVMKILTLISSILLPLTFIASMYGMNIDLPIQRHPASFLIVCMVMLTVAVSMIVYFKIRKWM
jgi:magnesium transporter